MRTEGNHPLRNALIMTACAGALLLAVASCTPVGHRHGTRTTFAVEIEPNDFPWSPDAIGFVDRGVSWSIRGHIDDLGIDTYDDFSFRAPFPVAVEVVLRSDDPFADLDFYVWDPDSGVYEFSFESPFNPEVGGFDVLLPDTDFVIEVVSFSGTTGYTLEVTGLGAFASQAASAGPSTGQRLSAAPEAGAGPAPEKAAQRARIRSRAAAAPGAPVARDADATTVLPARAVGALVEVDPADGSLRTRPVVLGEGWAWIGDGP